MSTSTVAVTTAAYTSLGTGPMLISPQAGIMIVAAASQPAATTVGHPLNFMTVPFLVTLAEQIWAIAVGGNDPNVVVTT